MGKPVRCQSEYAGHDVVCDPTESQGPELGRRQPGWDTGGIGMGWNQDQN